MEGGQWIVARSEAIKQSHEEWKNQPKHKIASPTARNDRVWRVENYVVGLTMEHGRELRKRKDLWVSSFIYYLSMRHLTKWVLYLCVSVLSVHSLAVWSFGIEDVDDYPFGDSTAWTDAGSIDFAKVIKKVAIDPTDSASEKIQESLGVAYAEKQRATYYIQELINRFLAIAWLVSLAVLIYGFYQMFLWKDNAEAFKEAMNIVKWAAIALVIIGVSWYLTSFFFDIFFEAKKDVW